MNNCRDCRFFTGKPCEITGYNRTPTYSCMHFSSNVASSNSRKCKDCRFFTGKICSINGYKRTPTYGCLHFSLYR